MRSYNRVCYELSCLQVYYKNTYLYKDDPSILLLVKAYESVIQCAPLKLVTVYRLVYKLNNSLAVAAEEMQISKRSMARYSKQLKNYFVKNLSERVLC